MIHHLVLLRWTPDTDVDRIARFAAALRALPATIPEIRSYVCGTGVNEGNWDFAIAASFDDLDGWRTYDEHPVHNAARAIVAAHTADRAAAQIGA